MVNIVKFIVKSRSSSESQCLSIITSTSNMDDCVLIKKRKFFCFSFFHSFSLVYLSKLFCLVIFILLYNKYTVN